MFCIAKSLTSKIVAIATVFLSALCWSGLASSQAVRFTPDVAIVTAGTSETITVSLDEPIICPPPGIPCSVQIVLVPPSADVTFSSGALDWTPAEWEEERIFVISVAQGVPLTANVVGLFQVSSQSEFYNGFVPAFRLSFGSALSVPINALWLLGALTVMLSIFGVRQLRNS